MEVTSGAVALQERIVEIPLAAGLGVSGRSTRNRDFGEMGLAMLTAFAKHC